MEVILLTKIRNLGDLGDKVRVKSGFARNFLVPYGKALPATNDNLQVFEERKAELLKNAEESLGKAKLRAKAVEGLVINLEAQASEEGNLYGSINAGMIAEAAQAQKVDVERSEIDLDEVIRTVGEHSVHFAFHADVSVEVKVVVEAVKAA